MAKVKKAKAGTSKAAAEAKRRDFVEAYIANGENATRAAISAGYSPRSAYSTAHEILKEPEVQDLLKQRRQQLASKHRIDAENVIAALAAVVHGDIRMLFDHKGNLLPVNKWPAEASQFVEQWKKTKGGTEVKMRDKLAAIDKAMKHLGLFKEDNKQKTDPLTALLERIADQSKEQGSLPDAGYGAGSGTTA